MTDIATYPDLDSVELELSYRSLRDFVAFSWPLIEPGVEYVETKHVAVICEYLEAVTCGDIQHLVINIAPRHTKSTVVSVAWQPWVWLRHPWARWLFASYREELALRDNARSRDLIRSGWYQSIPQADFRLSRDQNQKGRYENDKKGFRLATGTGGGAIGEGGDYNVADDPQDVEKIESKAYREHCIEWWDRVFSTRLNDRKKSHRVLIMHREHVDDIVGHIKEGEQEGLYTFLDLPTEAKERLVVSLPLTGGEWVREKGKLLCSERCDDEDVAVAKIELGRRGFEAQHNQNPKAQEGAILKRHHWRRYTTLPEGFRRFVLSCDSAFEKGETNDYSCFGLWGDVDGYDFYLLKLWRDRWEYPELKREAGTIYTQCDDWAIAKYDKRISKILIEKKSSGQALIQEMRLQFGKLIVAIEPRGDKEQRAHLQSPKVEAGRVFIPEDADWVKAFLDETEAFPGGKHDDQVDMTTQALGYLDGKKARARPSVRSFA